METHGTKPDLENANWTLQELIAGKEPALASAFWIANTVLTRESTPHFLSVARAFSDTIALSAKRCALR